MFFLYHTVPPGGGGGVFFLMIRRPPRSTLDRSSAASDVYKRQALGCATCEVWIDSISEPTNCSCSGSYDYNLEFKAAVAAILNYMSTPPTLCQSTIHIYTSTCWITSEPIIVGIGANGQPITMEFTTPCGENCCKNTYDLTTVPPTYLGTIVYNNGCLLYTSPSPRDRTRYSMPSSA